MPSAPPHQFLEHEAKTATFSDSLAETDLHETVARIEGLCHKVSENAIWTHRRGSSADNERPRTSGGNVAAAKTLIDATKALLALHDRGPTDYGGNGSIPSPAWSYFDGREADAGIEAWDDLGEAWEDLPVMELEDQLSMKCAKVVLIAYDRVYGFGYNQLDDLVRCDDDEWPAMATLRRGKCATRPVAVPSNVNVACDLIGKLRMTDRRRLGNAKEEFLKWIEEFSWSKITCEFVDQVVNDYCNYWNEAMQQPNPEESWTLAIMNEGSLVEMLQKEKLMEVITVNTKKEQEMKSFKRFFLEVTKLLRYSFEDAVDPENQIDIHRFRY